MGKSTKVTVTDFNEENPADWERKRVFAWNVSGEEDGKGGIVIAVDERRDIRITTDELASLGFVPA